MRDALKNVFGKEIILEDCTVFIYTIQPYELKNVLGQVAAVLDEYIFTKKGSNETYKLYRTSEGNWYDVPTANVEMDKRVLLRLKLGIETQINSKTL